MSTKTRHDPGLSAEELAALVDAIEDYAIFVLSPVGQIRSWNSGATRTMGYDADEIVGSHFSRFYGPEDLEMRKPQTELEIAAREGRVEDEGWRIRKDGTRFWANTVITPLRKADGSISGFAKVTRDLTHRREAEERLRESEEIFRLLVSSVHDYAIFLLDPGGHVSTWNAGARRIKGYAPEDIIGHHFSEFYPEEDVRNGKPELELQIARRDGSVEDEGWRVRKDGTLFWANVVITAVFDARGELRGFAKVTRDMTERKRATEMQQALFAEREARRAAEEANRAKEAFLMTLSHELRTPLTSILGWTRMLPGISPEDETFGEAIAAISRSAQLQARLIDDVLDVSRIVAGKLQLNIENVDVRLMLTASVESLRPSAEAKSVTVTTNFPAGLGTIAADAVRVQQIVWNLLTNAVKFSRENGNIEVRARRTDTTMEIAVIDDGEGIAPDFLPHVFDPFRQGENPRTRVHGGLGLGLSIVRYLVLAHEGTITAQSEGRGHGATFTLTLPIGRPVSESPQSIRAIPFLGHVADRLPATKILLVDDDTDGRRVVRTLLRQAGAEVTDVESAPLALDALAALQPQVVVTDIAMPHIDGYTLAREIHARAPEVKVVALSAFPQNRTTGPVDVFDAYISKPVEPRELIEAILRVVS